MATISAWDDVAAANGSVQGGSERSTPWAFVSGADVSVGRSVMVELWAAGQHHPVSPPPGAVLETLHVHQFGARPSCRRDGDLPVCAIARVRGDVPAILAVYDSVLLEITHQAPAVPMMHLLCGRGDELVFVDVWRHPEDMRAWLTCDLGRATIAQLEQHASHSPGPEALPVVQMAWPNSRRQGEDAPLDYWRRHEYHVHVRGRSYRVVYHPVNADGAGGGFVVNVFDPTGRAISGSDIADAPQLVSSASEARDIVLRTVGD